MWPAKRYRWHWRRIAPRRCGRTTSHAAVAVPDERKGEQIVLLTTNPVAQRVDLVSWAQSHGVAEIALPRRIVHIENIPLLGNGKTDYVTLEKTVRART